MLALACFSVVTFVFAGNVLLAQPTVAFAQEDTTVSSSAAADAASSNTGGSANLAWTTADGVGIWIGGYIAQVMNWVANGLGSITITLLEVVVIQVLNYNNFANSNIVTLGWTLTRDVVNMGVVIVLLVIAVKTMVGFKTGSGWDQQLPRLFGAVVLVNFSRTVCGLAIDASQIVMMTFVNALLDIAAGNFAQLLVMPQASQYSASTLEAASEAGDVAISVASNIANAYGKLIVQGAVMVVIVLLAVAFIWRIIVLWIAVIMSPLAFFAWGSKEVIGFLGSFWGQWMGQFTAALVLGPMLAFFLWLSLAAASNGNLAQTESFPEPEKRTTYGQLYLEIFESSNLTGLLLGVVFLLVGMKESAQWSSKLGGLAGKVINEKMGRRVMSTSARIGGRVARAGLAVPATLTRVGGNLTAAGLERTVGTGGLSKTARFVAKSASVAEHPFDSTVRGARTAGAWSAKKLTGAGAFLGSTTIMNAGTAAYGALHHLDEPENKKAKEAIAGMTEDVKLERLHQISRGVQPKTQEDYAIARNLQAEMLKDAKLFKKFRDASEKRDRNGKQHAENFAKGILAEYDHDKDHRLLDDGDWKKARSQFIDKYMEVDAAKAQAFIDSPDFDPRVMRDEAVGDPAVIAALKASYAKTESGKNISKWDELARGAYGSSKIAPALPSARNAGDTDRLTDLYKRGGARSVTLADLGNTTSSTPAPGVVGPPINVSVVQALIKAGTRSEDMAAEEVAEAARVAPPGMSPSITTADVRNTFVTQAFATQESDNLVEAYKNKQVDESDLRDYHFMGPNADNAVLAMAKADVDLRKTSSAVHDEIQAQLEDMETRSAISMDDANAIRKKLLLAGKNLGDLIPRLDLNAASNPAFAVPRDAQLRVQQVIQADPSAVRQLAPAVSSAFAATTRNDVTNTVIRGLTPQEIQKLGDMMRAETDVGRKTAIKEAMSVIDQTLRTHRATVIDPGGAGKAEMKRLNDLRNAYRAADRYMT